MYDTDISSPLAWKVHYDGQGKGIHHAPQIPITAGRDLNAMSNALKKQQEDFVKGASKLLPNGNKAPEAPQKATNGVPQTNGEQAGANVPVPDEAPTADPNQQNGQQNGQQVPSNEQQVQNGQKNNGFLHKVVSDAVDVPKNAISTAHDVTHDVVGLIPGGKQAENITHGIADNLIPGGHGLLPGSHQNEQQEQQKQHGLLPNPLDAAKQLPGNLFNR